MRAVRLQMGRFIAGPILVAAMMWVLPAGLAGQEAKVGWVDMERAIVQSAEGKKAEQAFNARFDELRKGVEKKQKELEDAQNKLKVQEKALNETMKADLSKTIARLQTEMTRINQDAQNELDGMRNNLMRPIAEVAERLINALANEESFTMIVDKSTPQNESLVYANPKADITNELIRRIDAEMAKAAPKKP